MFKEMIFKILPNLNWKFSNSLENIFFNDFIALYNLITILFYIELSMGLDSNKIRFILKICGKNTITIKILEI